MACGFSGRRTGKKGSPGGLLAETVRAVKLRLRMASHFGFPWILG